MNREPLRLLLAEDCDDDAVLVLNALEKQGFSTDCERVMTAAAFEAALTNGKFELILCDYVMPGFDALEAIEILQRSELDIPLIIVSGTIGESVAVEAMRCGACDYLLKDNLIRLGAAVKRELRDADIRRQKRIADESARDNEKRYLEQRNALIALTRETQMQNLRLEEAFLKISETTARTLAVERVSIWKHSDDGSRIECLDLYDMKTGAHASGTTLVAAEYPAYFKGLDSMELIAADDAVRNPYTCEFAEAYLKPLGIGAMLDVPVRPGGRLNYLLCCEHVGPPRIWKSDEKTFAVAIANLISLALESRERAQAELEVLQSHQRFQSVASATNDTIWDWNLETDEFWWNDGFAHLFGWSAQENKGTIRSWIRQIHPEDRGRVVTGIYAAIENGTEEWMDDYRFVSNNGSVSYVRDRGRVITDASGRPCRMVGGMMDMTSNRAAEAELARSHRALKMLSSCNEMLVRTLDEGDLLDEACRIAVEVGGFRMAWVGFVNADEPPSIVPKALVGEGADIMATLEIESHETCPMGTGPAGLAVVRDEAVLVEDIIDMADFKEWARQARQLGYNSVVSLPLRQESGVFGVITLYSDEPHPAGFDEISLLHEMAKDLSFGIGNIRSRREKQRTEEVVVKVAQAVSSGMGSEFFDLLTRNMVEALGASGGVIARCDPYADAVEIISGVFDGVRLENVSYPVVGTPCGDVAKGTYVVMQRGIRSRYPGVDLLDSWGVEGYAGIPLRRQDGGVAGIMAVLFREPMTETSLVASTLRIFAARAAAELDRQTSDARIREQASLLDKAQDAILVRDMDHTITYWNKSAERLYGWTAEEAIGASVADLLYRNSEAFLEAHLLTLADGEWVGEMNQFDKMGRELVIEGRWTLVRDDKGDPQSVFAINTDISEHRMLQQQFIRAQRMESIGTLAGGIAHDLNNILAPISMAVELLKMRETDDRKHELLDTIAASTKRGAKMVGQVLSFARGVEGQRVEIRPRDLITEIEGMLRDTLPRNIHLRTSIDHDLWTIKGDPTQLHQVLLNLCVNARDAIGSEGTITVSACNIHPDPAFISSHLDAKDEPYVCIRVEDDGEGIDPAIKDRIFDPFFTTKAIGKGTGLGLATTLTILKSHGGFIHVESSPGHGTEFVIYLPASPELAPLARQEPVRDLPRGMGETILVVDDEEPIRRTACNALEAFGYRTLTACNGLEALSIYSHKGHLVDCVITDMMMPVMDGMAAIENLRNIDPDIRIIATSGLRVYPEVSTADEQRPVVFLAKPFTAESLVRTLGEVLAE